MNTFVRWGKFNLVGAMGMAVQLGSLAALTALWPGHLLVATAAALELTLLHNFAWHLRYTWRDRGVSPVRRAQLARFHLSNGLVSIVGNLVLMPMLVHRARIPVVPSNAIAIVCCSLINFYLANNWAFAAPIGVTCSAAQGASRGPGSPP